MSEKQQHQDQQKVKDLHQQEEEEEEYREEDYEVTPSMAKACKSDDSLDTVKKLVDEIGLPINRPIPDEHCRDMFGSALHAASRNGAEKVASYLLSRGAEGATPLDGACEWKSGEAVVEMFKYLSKGLSKDEFQSVLKDAKEKWRMNLSGKPLSDFLNEEMMSSINYNLLSNSKNSDKGAR